MCRSHPPYLPLSLPRSKPSTGRPHTPRASAAPRGGRALFQPCHLPCVEFSTLSAEIQDVNFFKIMIETLLFQELSRNKLSAACHGLDQVCIKMIHKPNNEGGRKEIWALHPNYKFQINELD